MRLTDREILYYYGASGRVFRSTDEIEAWERSNPQNFKIMRHGATKIPPMHVMAAKLGGQALTMIERQLGRKLNGSVSKGTAKTYY